PFNPVSALLAVSLALAAKRLAKPEDLIYILAPSPTQGAFLRALIQDLAPTQTGLAAGEPSDLAAWPKAALVILDTALGREHPWAWPAPGRAALLTARRLAKGALVLVGDEEAIADLPYAGPLPRLWRDSVKSYPSFRWPIVSDLTMWEALNRAQREALFCLPAFEPNWWTPLSIHFQGALNRNVRITILTEPPPPQDPEARKYCDAAIRDLKLFGAQVVVAEGFSDLMGLIDQKSFAFGLPPSKTRTGSREWNNVWTLELPHAAPIIAYAAQAPLIAEKLGPRGFRHCPQCGWPYVLVNKARAQDFNHRQPLRLGCLNPGCPNHRNPRRLDERWPFLAPPVCPQDETTPYIRVHRGRGEVWVCPLHERECPRLKVIPGDATPNKGA
ncbi:MAG: phospholipase D family protein, partial [Deltaproteobacteria bacterium]|nr:phospholipase D family protein [Deltaproteobacteria bacterium]